MKKTIFSVLFLLGCIQLTNAQQYNKELLKGYSNAELTKIEQEKPEQIKVLEYAVNHACYYIAKPEGKAAEYPTIDTHNGSTNFAELGLKITDKTQYFTAKETGKLLVVKSLYVLELEMKNK